MTPQGVPPAMRLSRRQSSRIPIAAGQGIRPPVRHIPRFRDDDLSMCLDARGGHESLSERLLRRIRSGSAAAPPIRWNGIGSAFQVPCPIALIFMSRLLPWNTRISRTPYLPNPPRRFANEYFRLGQFSKSALQRVGRSSATPE